MATSRPQTYSRGTVTRTCLVCETEFEAQKRGNATAVTCSPSCRSRYSKTGVPRVSPGKARLGTGTTATLTCEQCETDFLVRTPKQVATRRFCSNRCAAMARMAPPERREAQSLAVREHWSTVPHPHKGKKRPDVAKRMRENNPMRNPETLAKMTASKQGATFLSRGGNGQLTRPQILLAEATGLPTEYAIGLPVSWLRAQGIQSPPTNYKVDLAHIESKTAIEVDGATHKTPRWRFLDRRKTDILGLLGWSVLRFWNEEVLADPEGVAEQIRTFTTSRLQGTTTTSQMAS